MRPFSLMIARFPGQNQEHPDSSGYIINLQETLLNDDRVGAIHPFRISDTPITMCRNRCVKEAIDKGVDYLLMIDSDISPDCEPGAPTFWETAWDFMMKRRRQEEMSTEIEYTNEGAYELMNQGVWMTSGRYTWRNTKTKNGFTIGEYYAEGGVQTCPFHYYIETERNSQRTWKRKFAAELIPVTIAAPYCGPPPHECVYVFRWLSRETGGADPSFKLEMFDRDHAASLRGMGEVAALPTGLILYDMRVFRRLPMPWFAYEWTDATQSQKASTEDVYQTRNASLLGMPQYCAWDCWAGHVKAKTVRKPQPMTTRAMRHEFSEAVLKNLGGKALTGRMPLPDASVMSAVTNPAEIPLVGTQGVTLGGKFGR